MAVLSVGNIVTRLNHAFKDRLQNSALYQLFAEINPAPVNVTAATFEVTSAHVNKIITLNRAAGIAITLPAATGTGDRYSFYVGTTFTGNCTIDTVGSDVMQGMAIFNADSTGDVTYTFPTTSSTDTLTMYTAASNTTGGIVGAMVELRDVAAGVYSVLYFSEAGGTEVTPFS